MLLLNISINYIYATLGLKENDRGNIGHLNIKLFLLRNIQVY